MAESPFLAALPVSGRGRDTGLYIDPVPEKGNNFKERKKAAFAAAFFML
nr:hypothetical protein [Planococcus glaciei]